MEPKKTAIHGQAIPGGMNMIGIVLGELALVRGSAPVLERRWVQVRAGEQTLPAVDLAGCAKGDVVLLVTGPAARIVAMGCPGDWAVAAVLRG